MTLAQQRTRTFAWSDPAQTARAIGASSGIEMLRAMVAGELPPPPIMQALGFDGFEVEEGRAAFLLTPQEYHYNPLGSVHGGVIATLLDSAAGCSVHSVLPAGRGYTSLDLSVKYLRPVTVHSGQLRCVGGVLSQGRTTALAEARLLDAAGRLAAYATSTCMLFDLPASG
ncbi:MAG: PaaI family thioesterase [Micromonosporaceae bacterium]|nr:PaaI family thioesterase [Micromonosporaceae bacterium]